MNNGAHNATDARATSTSDVRNTYLVFTSLDTDRAENSILFGLLVPISHRPWTVSFLLPRFVSTTVYHKQDLNYARRVGFISPDRQIGFANLPRR